MEPFEYQDMLNRLQETNDLSRYFRFLHETTLGLINNLELNDLLTAIINRAADLVNTKHAFLYLRGPEEGVMTLTLGIGIYQNLTFKLREGEWLVGKAWATKKPMLVNRYCEWDGRLTSPPFNATKATLAVPLISDSEVMGVIGLAHIEDDHTFFEAELSMVCQFAELASLALVNSTLYDTVKKELAVRKKIEKALQNSESMHRALLDTIPDTLLRINKDCHLLSSKAGDKLSLSIQLDDYIGENIASIFPLEIVPFFHHAIKKVFDTGKMEEFECRTKSAVGLKDWEVRVVAAGADEVLIIMRDISDRKRAEAKVLEAKRALAGIEKLTSLATMSAGIAHEINQPLTSIKFAADSILFWLNHEQKMEQEEMLDYIKDISIQASRIGNIVKQICSIIKGQSFSEFASCDLNGAVEGALKRLGSQLRLQGIIIKKDLAGELLLVGGESMILEQVIVNLLTNSIQALDDKDQPDREIIIITKLEDRVILEIQDNGLGIREAVLNEIYDPFFTTKANEENMGLGLFLVHGIVTTYGGQLRACNREQGGASFRIEFPVKDNAEWKERMLI